MPLAPNWKLAPDGTGVRVVPHLGGGPGDAGRHCSFEIVRTAREQSAGTVKGGAATCPYSDCGRVIDGDQVKAQAQAGDMGEQLFAVVFKRKLPTQYTKAGKPKKAKWERGYRAPRPEDDKALRSKPHWPTSCRVKALDLVPNEKFPRSAMTTAQPVRHALVARSARPGSCSAMAPVWRSSRN